MSKNISQIYSKLQGTFDKEKINKLIQAFAIDQKKENFVYVNRDQIRELDKIAIEKFKIPGIILMENAGACAAKIISNNITKGPVAILCGAGNNGGDGFVIARHLYNKGIKVSPYFIGDQSKIIPNSDAAINLEILRQMDLEPVIVADISQISALIETAPPEVIVDALLGTGLKGNVRGKMQNFIDFINKLQKPVFSIDIPSGLDASTGRVLGTAVKATATITFALPKIGFIAEDGPDYTGHVFVVDISIPKNIIENLERNNF